MRMSLSCNGSSILLRVSFSHFKSICLADLYELQVLFATPMFPNSARDWATSSGNWKSASRSLVHPPAVPYFLSPFMALGVNLCPNVEIKIRIQGQDLHL